MKSSLQSIEHPIKMYIKRDLAITVEQFGFLVGIPQPTLATWIKRDRRIESLPLYFFLGLKDVSGESLDAIYRKLITWQQRYDQYRYEVLTQAAGELPDFSKGISEGRKIWNDYSEKKKLPELSPLAKTLRQAIDRKNQLRFMETLIAIYAKADRVLPEWIIQQSTDPESLLAFGNAFYNELMVR